MLVDIIKSAEGVKRTKRLTHPWARGISSAWVPSSVDISFFPAIRLELKHWPFLGLEPTTLQAGTTPSSLLELQLTNYRSWGLSPSIIMSIDNNNNSNNNNTQTYIHISPIGSVFSGEPWIMQVWCWLWIFIYGLIMLKYFPSIPSLLNFCHKGVGYCKLLFLY